MSPPIPPELVAAMVSDYASGMSCIQVARKYGVSDSTVLRYVGRAGISRPLPTAKLCGVEECQSGHRAHGYCGKHLERFRRYGDPLAGRGPNEPTDEQLARLEDLRWMAEMGEHLDGAAERLGLPVKTIEAFLRRHDPRALAKLIARRPRDHNRIIYGDSTTALSGLSQARRDRKQRREQVPA